MYLWDTESNPLYKTSKPTSHRSTSTTKMSAWGLILTLLLMLLFAAVTRPTNVSHFPLSLKPNSKSQILQLLQNWLTFYVAPCFCHIESRMFLFCLKANGSVETWPEMVPATERVEMLMMNGTRRRLGSFRICALCTCCGGAKGLCLPSPCCYAINCNIPNRPFGFCSFTPKTCNCFGCHLWI